MHFRIRRPEHSVSLSILTHQHRCREASMGGQFRRGLKKEEGGWTWTFQPTSCGRLCWNGLRRVGVEYSDVQILTIHETFITGINRCQSVS